MPGINDLVSEYLNELTRFVGVMWLVSNVHEEVIGGGVCGSHSFRVGIRVVGRDDPFTYGLLGIQPGIQVKAWVQAGSEEFSVRVDTACVGGKCVPYQSIEYGPLPKNTVGLLVLYPIIGGTPMWGSIREACGPYADIAAWVFQHAGPINQLDVKAPAPGGAAVNGFLSINGKLGIITVMGLWGVIKWDLHVIGGDTREPGVEEALAKYLAGRARAIHRGTNLLLSLGGLLGIL